MFFRIIGVVIFACVILFAGFEFLDSFLSKRRNKNRFSTCYHTELDCENCVNATTCTQKYGPGYIKGMGE